MAAAVLTVGFLSDQETITATALSATARTMCWQSCLSGISTSRNASLPDAFGAAHYVDELRLQKSSTFQFLLCQEILVPKTVSEY